MIKEWEWYENGKNYNKRLEPSYYDTVDCNWDFFYGDQWRNAGLSDDLPQPVFNQINRFVTFFVASILMGYFGHPSLAPTMAGKRMNCFNEILVLSWIPILSLSYLANKAYPFSKKRIALFIGLAGASLPMSMMQFACMYDPIHALIFHILPGLSVGIVGAFLAKKMAARR